MGSKSMGWAHLDTMADLDTTASSLPGPRMPSEGLRTLYFCSGFLKNGKYHFNTLRTPSRYMTRTQLWLYLEGWVP